MANAKPRTDYNEPEYRVEPEGKPKVRFAPCAAYGCTCPHVIYGLCEWHAEIVEHPNAWPRMTELLKSPKVLALRRGLMHINRAGIKHEEEFVPEAAGAAADLFGMEHAKRLPHPNPRYADRELEPPRVYAYRMQNMLRKYLAHNAVRYVDPGYNEQRRASQGAVDRAMAVLSGKLSMNNAERFTKEAA